MLKKIRIIAILVLLSFLLFVNFSCSSDAAEFSATATADVSLSVRSSYNSDSKGVTVITDNVLAANTVSSYYWTYTAVKKDSYGKTGEKTAETALNGGERGLSSKLVNMSVGKWQIQIFGYLTTTYDYNNIVYMSQPEIVEIKANTENVISLLANRVQGKFKGTDTKGVLEIDPKQVSIALDVGAIAVTRTYVTRTDNVYIDEKAFNSKFGRLSEYDYRIVECDENWNEKTVLRNTTAEAASENSGTAGNVDSGTTYTNANAATGLHYIKIEITRARNAQTSEMTQNGAEQYLALLRVNVFANCKTVIVNDGDGDYSGILVKRIKEFKVSYYDMGASDNLPFTGTHGKLTGVDGKVTSHTTVHQYGRTEELDMPAASSEDKAFAGWYTAYNGGILWDSIPAWEYSDIKLYAKWDTKQYSSITYDDNFPEKSVTRTAHGTDVAGSSSTTGAVEPVMPSDPAAVGYVFKGWYVDSSHSGYTATNGLPVAWLANQKVVCVAQWEPLHYKVEVRCHSSINPATDFENYAEISAQVLRLKTSWSSYDVEYAIIDPQSSKYGFIGYKRGNSNASDASNYTYEASKMEGLNGTYKNLSTTNGETVYFYALFSDYFTPLEYIRSYTAVGNAGPWIDTGVVRSDTADASKYSRVVMEMEFSGNYNLSDTYGYFFGASGAFQIGAYTTNAAGRNASRWDFWKGAGDDPASGNWFYDQRYKVEAIISDSRIQGYVDDEKIYDETIAVATGGTTAGIFHRNGGTNTNSYRDIRLYYCYLFNSAGTLVRRFQPCVLKANVPAEFSSDGVAYSTGAVGLWDLKSNKFYPNKGSGRFYQPSDEIIITLKNHDNNTNAELQADRKQKILKTSVLSSGEKLHMNIFSKVNSIFLGWGTTYNATANAYSNGASITANSNMTLYARWSNPVSYNLFEQVEWLGFRNGAFMLTNEYLKGKGIVAEFNFRVISYPLAGGSSQPWQGFFGARRSNTANQSVGTFIQAQNKTLHAPYSTGGDSITLGAIGTKQTLRFDFNQSRLSLSYGSTVLSYPINSSETTLVTPILIGNVSEIDGGTYLPHSTVTAGGAILVSTATTQYTYVNKAYVHNNCEYDIFNMTVSLGGSDLMNLVPAILTTDLKTNTVVDGANNSVVGTSKVLMGRTASKGDYGFWDLVADKFYPFFYGYGVVPTDFYIYYQANGALGNMLEQKIASSTNDVRLSENRFEKPGYDFIGWNTKADGSGTWYSAERVIHKSAGEIKNMTLFAQWRPEQTSKPYEVLDYLDGGGTTSLKSIINTGFTVNTTQGRRVMYETMFLKSLNSQSLVFGGCSGTDGGNFGLLYAPSGNAGKIFNGFTQLTGAALSLNTRYTVDIQFYNSKTAGELYSAGVSLAYTYGSNAGTGMALNNASFFSNYSSLNGTDAKRIYWGKLWDPNEKLVRDYVPVMLTQDIAASSSWDGKAHYAGELGFWDRSNGGLNNGSGKFYGNGNSSGYFTNDNVVQIFFNANGGTGTMHNQAFLVTNEKTALKANEYKNGTKKFIGWNTNADGTGVWYHDKYATNAWKGGTPLTLYAIWDNTTYNGNKIGDVKIDYFEVVNYIKIPAGGAYMNTHVYPYANFKGEIFYYWSSGYTSIFGANNGNTNWNNLILFQGGIDGGNSYAFHYYYSNKNVVPAVSTLTVGDHRAKFDGASFTFDGTTYNVTGYNAFNANNNDYSILVGRTRWTKTNAGSWYNAGGVEKLYYLAMTGGENITSTVVISKLFVPCRLLKKISNYEAGTLAADAATHNVGEVGMWDLINNVFYGNEGTGSFSCEL